MVKDNINKPNPQHYKLELKSVPVVIDGKEVVVDRLQLETRHILKDVVNGANMTHEQASWYWSMGKRYFRLCKKHDEPTTDIKKIIQEATFLLSSVLGKEYKARLLDENGNDLLNDKEEIAVFDKLNNLLTEKVEENKMEINIDERLVKAFRKIEEKGSEITLYGIKFFPDGIELEKYLEASILRLIKNIDDGIPNFFDENTKIDIRNYRLEDAIKDIEKHHSEHFSGDFFDSLRTYLTEE